MDDGVDRVLTGERLQALAALSDRLGEYPTIDGMGFPLMKRAIAEWLLNALVLVADAEEEIYQRDDMGPDKGVRVVVDLGEFGGMLFIFATRLKSGQWHLQMQGSRSLDTRREEVES